MMPPMNTSRTVLFAACLALVACSDDENTEAPAGSDAGHDATDVSPDVEDTGNGDSGDTTDTGADTAPDTPDAEPDAGDPRPIANPGPYYVGYAQLEASYTPAGMEEARTLRLAVWYPTNDTEGEDSFYRDLLPREGIWTDAAPAEGPFPLLMFSHGSRAFAEQSAFLTEFMTSHGWVVVAPDHTGNTLFDEDTGPTPPALFELRPQDISAALDHILALPAEHPLAGLTGTPIAAAGHSFGGYTMLALGGASFGLDNLDERCIERFDEELCEYLTPAVVERLEVGYADDRIETIVPLAPGGYAAFEGGVADIDVPTLLMTGGVDTFTTDEEEGDPIWAAMDGENDIRIHMPAAGHFTFSDVCELGLPVPGNDSCGPENIPTAQAHPILAQFVLDYVTGNYAAFDGPSGHDGIEIHHKTSEK